MAAVTHHLRPEPGVTEIRVHGVGGTTPEALLDQTGLQQVTGDDKAGMFRGAIPQDGRTVEAYSWGGLTARSKSRAFWVLLLPFSIVNLSGWMVEPPREYQSETEYTSDTWTRTPGTKWHEVFVQLIALSATAMYVMWAALIAMNVLAFQCGGLADCREDRWYAEFLGANFFVNHPGRRIVVALVIPLGLLAFFWWLGTVSRSRYDEYGEGDREIVSSDAAVETSAVGISGFWYMSDWQRDLGRLHVAMVLAILAGLLGRAAGEFERHFAVEVVPDGVGPAVFWLSLLVALVVAGGLAFATWTSGRLIGDGVAWVKRFALGTLAASALLLVVAVALTWRLEVVDARLFAPLPGQAAPAVPTPNTDLWGFGWAPIILLGLAALFIGTFSAVELWRWFRWRLVHLDQLLVALMLAFVVWWPAATWVAVVAAGVGIVAQLLPRWVASVTNTPQVRGSGEEWWRLWIFLGLCLLAALVAWITDGAGARYGSDWPRMTPVLLFTGVLVVLSLVQSGGGRWNNSGPAAERRARVALAAIPTGLVVLGFILEAWLGPPEWLYGMTWLAWTVAAVAWLAQFRFNGWRWNGPAAVAVLGLAILMGAFSGLVIWLVDLLDRDGAAFALQATALYEWLVVAFAAMVIAIAGGLAAWYVLVTLGITRRRDGGILEDGEALPEALRGIDVVITVASLLVVAGLAALVVHLDDRYGADVRQWINDGAPDTWGGIVRGAYWIALGVPIGAFIAVRNGLRDHAFRTRFGILWDVASFWPRSFHPFAPPAYAVRAVPEIQARLTEIVTDASAAGGWHADGRERGAAILSGHSQGSVVSLAAVASLRSDVRPWVRLVTHGSPLVRFYQQFFPRYFPPTLFDYCAASLGSSGEVAGGGWLNFYRRTDPIGDAAFGAAARPLPDGYPSPGVREALQGSLSRAEQLPDVCLADPIVRREYRFAPQPSARKHSGYMADPAMHLALDALAADLTAELAEARRVATVGEQDRHDA